MEKKTGLKSFKKMELVMITIAFMESAVTQAYEHAEEQYQELKPIADSIDGKDQEDAYDAGYADGQREMAFQLLKDLQEIKKSVQKTKNKKT